MAFALFIIVKHMGVYSLIVFECYSVLDEQGTAAWLISPIQLIRGRIMTKEVKEEDNIMTYLSLYDK